MHLAPGRYRFTTSSPYVTSVIYDVDAGGIKTPAGYLEWDAAGDCYRLGQTALAVTPPSSFVATTPGTPAIAGSYSPAP